MYVAQMTTRERRIELGAAVECSDGPAGKVTGFAVDPSSRRLAHLIVAPSHKQARAHLVPVGLVAPDPGDGGALRLGCTQAELETQSPAAQVTVRPGYDERAVDPFGYVRVGGTVVHADAGIRPPEYAADAGTPSDVVPGSTVELHDGTGVVDREYRAVGQLRALVVDAEWGIAALEAAAHHFPHPRDEESTIPIADVAAIEPDVVRLAVDAPAR
jgi:hypothetical protein